MLSIDQVRELRKKLKFLNSAHYINLEIRKDGQNLKQEGDWIKQFWQVLDEREAALKVVEATKAFHDKYKDWNDGIAYQPLAEALAPVTAKTGEA